MKQCESKRDVAYPVYPNETHSPSDLQLENLV